MTLMPASARPRPVLAIVGFVAGVVVAAFAAAAEQPDRQAVEVDRYLGVQMKRLGIPGMAVAVVKDGQLALIRTYGNASVEFGIPVSADTAFAINSITKAFTGVAAMRLAEQGRLDLSAPVGRYLADLPEAWRKVTLRQLLSHMSGLPDMMRAPTVETDVAVAWAWVQAQPLRFLPGARFDYCQTNYTLIQRIVNQIEGRPLEAPLAEEQLRMAAMSRTVYGDATTVIPGKAPTYRWALGGPMIAGYRAAASTIPSTLTVSAERFLPFRRASSGLNSTIGDMARWLMAVENGRLLKADSLATLWAPAAFNDGRLGQWGLGWQVLTRGTHRAVGMTGGGRAAAYLYPEDKVGVVILTNLAGAFPEDMVDKIASLYASGLDLSGVPALRIALEEQGYDQVAAAADSIERAHPGMAWPELELNDWGYRLLSTGRARDALAVLRFVAERFPDSANAHDSLAQASLVNGDKEMATLHYRRALALDPSNSGAARHLAELVGPGKS
ncbi:serine hydrolase domain-containing protein [Duganella sp. HH105]|uniref:serine hydrolase domain-containing protein n=1 Tax=Duganella sp. HH105 TaxID=1781067 RepID=UPI000893DB92|nr:serine hydrolase domain-containing protein [Duganella sp. HH105]OEZ62740.1 beta-lactamase precursor [Duganella sp. HH105]